jgi:ethanolamine kinase
MNFKFHLHPSQIFSAGITNKLIGAFNKTHPRDDSQEILLIRVNGNQTDLLIDRKAEKLNFQFLHSHELAPKIYAFFENGICYKFIHGVTLNAESVRDEKIWSQIAVQMAKMHKLKLTEDQNKIEPMIKNKTEKYLKLIPEKFSNWEIGER